MIRTQEDIARALDALIEIAPDLREVAECAGPIPLRAAPAGLRGLVGTMIGQHVSRASADAVLRRLSAEIDLDDPAAIRAAEASALRAAGLSRAKERTLLAIAEAVQSGAIDLGAMHRAAPAEAIAALVRLPGIGPWTAECFLLFSAGHADIFPAGDLALQVAVGHARGMAGRPKALEVAALARAFAPHRSIAARLFWTYYATLSRGSAAPAPTPPERPIAAESAGFTKATR